MKNIKVLTKKGQSKPLIICETGEQLSAQGAEHFIADEAQLKRTAEKIVKSVKKTNKRI